MKCENTKICVSIWAFLILGSAWLLGCMWFGANVIGLSEIGTVAFGLVLGLVVPMVTGAVVMDWMEQ